MRRPATCAAIGVVAVASTAAFVRCWRLGWGLSETTRYLGFPDEILLWLAYVRDFIPLSWSSFDHLNLNYPTLYGYLVGLTTAALHAIGLITIADPQHPFLHPAPDALLVARGISVVASLATIAIVGLTAARMYSRRAGLFAAALMAVVPFEILYAHLASPDILLTTFFAATTLLAQRTAVGSKPWLAAIAAGLAAGAATATKYTGLASIVVVAWAVGEHAYRRGSLRTAWLLGALAAAGFATAVSAGCPPCLLHPDRMLEAMRMHAYTTTSHQSVQYNNMLAPSLGWYGRPYLHQLVAALPFVLGWPMYALALAGVVVAVRRRNLADRLLFAGAAPYFAVMGASMLVFPRYLLPIVPALVVAAARAADSIRSRAGRTVVVATVCAYSLVLAVSQVSRFSLDQQRAVADWIAEAASTRATRPVRVGVPEIQLDYFRLSGPLASRGLTRIDLAAGHWFDDPPEFLVLPEWYEIAIERDMAGSPVAADLGRLRAGKAGYREQAKWSSSYLQRGLYTALDPAFAADLWQGEIGFTIYVRPDSAEF